MSALKTQLKDIIDGLPDEKLAAIKPLLNMIYDDTAVIEKVDFDNLNEDEKAAVIESRRQIANGEFYRADEIDWDNLDKLDLD